MIGTAAAWLVERTDLPGRRIWAVLVVLPVAIPDFVVSYGWVSVAPASTGLRAPSLVMTLASTRWSTCRWRPRFRGADPGQEEVARSLGLGRVGSLLSGSPCDQARPALLGGCLLVSPGPAGRVRGLRDPALPDLHHRDLHRVTAQLQHRRGLVALARPGAAQPGRSRRRRRWLGAQGRVSPAAARGLRAARPTVWAGPPCRRSSAWSSWSGLALGVPLGRWSSTG